MSVTIGANSFSGLGGDTAQVAYLIGADGQINKIAGLALIVVDPDSLGVAVYPLAAPTVLDKDKGITIDVNWNS